MNGGPATIASSQPAATVPVAAQRGWLSDVIELTKPRIAVMVAVSAAMTMVIAAGRIDDPWKVWHVALGTALVAGSAGAINQYFERRIDSHMPRTRRRPLPAERLSAATGLGVALLALGLGSFYLGWFVGRQPLYLSWLTWLLYAFIYTPMKRWTAWNTTVGAVSGALPMLMGWTAGGGSLTDPVGWLLFGVMFLWQYPHFMALAWLYRHQYDAAGLRMSSVVEPTGGSTARQAIVGALTLLVAGGLTARLLDSNWIWPALAVIVSVPLLHRAWQFGRVRDEQTARRLLRSSLLQLPVLLIVLLVAAL
jgi:protoheme IX farnesyltransferase